MKINSINNQYNYNNKMFSAGKNTENSNMPSFKAAPAGPVTEALAGMYGKTAKTGIFQKFVKKLSSYDSFKILLIAESFYLSSWYLINDLFDKKIDKDQKPQMAAHDILTFGMSTAGALLIDDGLSAAVKKGGEKHIKNHSDYYIQLGKEALKKKEVSPLTELIESASRAAGETGGKLQAGIKETLKIAQKGMKGLAGKDGRLNTFQITKEKYKEVQDGIEAAIKNASNNTDAAKGLKETLTSLTGKLFEQAAARAEADKTIDGLNKIGKILMVAFTYRYFGSVLASRWSVKLTDKLFPNKKNNDGQDKIKKK